MRKITPKIFAICIALLFVVQAVNATYAWDLPDLPDFPDFPVVPKLPDPPKLPDLPEIPEFPKLPDLPKLPSLPKLPDLPELSPAERAGEWLDRLRTDPCWKEISETAKNDWTRALAIVDQYTGTYRRNLKDALYLETRRQLCNDYRDPQKVGELYKKRSLPTEATIIALKLLPVYNPETGQVQTFDAFSRDIIGQDSTVNGSDLAKDPVRFAILIMLDSDYLTKAQIIQTSDGRWISIAEAQVIGYRSTEAGQATADYYQAKRSYANGDSAQIEKNMKSFSSRIESINTQGFMFDPLWLIPAILVVFLAAGIVINRRKRKETQKIS